MTTTKLNADIDSDGTLHLDIPLGLPPGKAEVIVVVQPQNSTAPTNEMEQKQVVRSGLFSSDQVQCGDIDIDATLNEMDEAWKSKISAGLRG